MLDATAYLLIMEKYEATTPAGWRESLERSKAQIAAGEAVPLLPVLDRLRAAARLVRATHAQGIAQ